MRDALQSTDNPLVKELSKLHDAKHRHEAGTFLVEGRRAIDGCLQGGWTPRVILVREGLEIPGAWPRMALGLMGERVAERLSQATTPSGYVAAFPVPPEPKLRPDDGGLVLCGLSDPGNVGTLLRCAAAFAIQQVVLVGGCDVLNHKVVQAAAGTLPKLELHRWGPGTTPDRLAGAAPRCALVVRGGAAPDSFASGARWLVVGGEADGLTNEWQNACEERLTLPMPGHAESLNAAVAGAIACYLLLRG